MQIQAALSTSDSLPLRGSLTNAFILSSIVAIITTAVSIAGVIYQETIYPTAELRESFVPNDAVNLLVGMPFLLGSMWLARNGRLTGLLLWPGALLYGIYNYVAYVIGRPVDWLTLLCGQF